MSASPQSFLTPPCPLTPSQRFIKRSFDIFLALFGITVTWWIMVIAIGLATLDTRKWGLFSQARIGRYGKPFHMFKVRSMREMATIRTNVTRSNDPRITLFGKFIRRTKIDELPQFFNVLMGDMSFVGPRPDVRGYADRLKGDDRVILTVRPGIIGPGTLKYLDEEEHLSRQENSEDYNRFVIYPDKVKLNKAYVMNYSIKEDLKYILRTFTRLKYHYQ